MIEKANKLLIMSVLLLVEKKNWRRSWFLNKFRIFRGIFTKQSKRRKKKDHWKINKITKTSNGKHRVVYSRPDLNSWWRKIDIVVICTDVKRVRSVLLISSFFLHSPPPSTDHFYRTISLLMGLSFFVVVILLFTVELLL